MGFPDSFVIPGEADNSAGNHTANPTGAPAANTTPLAEILLPLASSDRPKGQQQQPQQQQKQQQQKQQQQQQRQVSRMHANKNGEEEKRRNVRDRFYRQIGNAVCPPVISAVGKELLAVLLERRE